MLEIEVADDALAAQRNGVSEFPGVFSGWLGPVQFLISPLASPGGASLTALASVAHAASERFWCVTDQGLELPGTWATWNDRVPDEVVEPRIFDDGVVVLASWKDEITPPQAATMLRIVLAELHAQEVSARVSCPPSGLDVRSLPFAPSSGAQSDGSTRARDESEKRWYVSRAVRTSTTTGVPYDEAEWLQPDRTWSRSQTGAISFDDTASGKAEVIQLVTELRQQADAGRKDPRLGEVNGFLTSPEVEARSTPMPPDSIRDHGHTWTEPSAEG